MADTTLNYFVARGTNAERLAFTPDPPSPANAPPAQGYFFYCTDTGNTFAWDGAAWDQISAGASSTRTIGITIDGGGSVIATGWKGVVEVPFACTITAVRVFSCDDNPATSGSIVVDVLKCAYAGYDTFSSIVASAPPTLSSAIKSQDTTLTGWTTSFSAGDLAGFKVTSASGVKKVVVQMTVTS